MDDAPTTALAREPEPGDFRSLAPPVHRGSTVVFGTMAEYVRRRERFYDGYSYGLYGTPTSRDLERRIATLEGAARCYVVPSGMAAITLVTLSCAAGGRVLFPDSAYDPVRNLATTLLAPCGIEARFYDPMIGGGIASLLTPATRLVWVESPGSVTMEVQDLPAIAAAANRHGALVAADTTWATPLRCRALDQGADFAVNAVSKYLNGHSDVLMGAVSVRDEALYRRLRDVGRALGHGVSPEDCALVMRGLETLELRLDRAEATALRLARWLAERPEVKTVLHPALESCPGHATWRRDFRGASGVFSVVLATWTRPRLPAVVEALRCFAIGASWGATRSLVAPIDPAPLRTAVPASAKGPILRISAGLENPALLEADLAQAFALFGASCGPADHALPPAVEETIR
jgi:cysteine-S-conjugate beta-lyase